MKFCVADRRFSRGSKKPVDVITALSVIATCRGLCRPVHPRRRTIGRCSGSRSRELRRRHVRHPDQSQGGLSCVVLFALWVVSRAANRHARPSVDAQQAPPSLTGRGWKGAVTARWARCRRARRTATGAKAVGERRPATRHEDQEATLEKGVWTLQFTTEDGPSGVRREGRGRHIQGRLGLPGHGRRDVSLTRQKNDMGRRFCFHVKRQRCPIMWP